MNIRLRPIKSAIRPPISNRPPNANVYAVRAHWRLASEMCRARWAEGRAIVTTEASRTIMSWAMAITPSARKRRGSGSSRTTTGASRGVPKLVAITAPPGRV